VRCDAVDAVLVCLPDGLHEEVTVEAARCGKHVLVEKPMSRNLRESKSMVTAAAEAAVVLMVAQSSRWVDSHLQARRLIRDGRIGTVVSAVRRRHGNVIDTVRDKTWYADPQMTRDLLLYGLGSHEYDAMLWLLESEAEEVVATGRKDPAIWPGWISIESSLKLRNGITCDVSMAAKSDAAHGDTRIEGSKGSMTITQQQLTVDGEDIDLPWDAITTFAAQLGEFADCVRTGRQPGPSGSNVQATMAVLEGLYESLQTERSVALEEIGVVWG
jgi:xylose dehydrogenase (NAD/NADP)